MADRESTYGTGESADRGTGSRAKEKAKDVKEQVAHAASGAKDQVSHAAEEMKEKGEELVHEGKEKARELGDRASHMARGRVEEGKGRVSGGIRSMADALRRGGRDLPEENRQYGRLLDAVADRAEGVSRYLDEHDVDALTRDARRFAREHTPILLSGAFTLGMLGARFMKSSNHHDDEGYGARGPRTSGTGRYASPRGTEYGRYRADDRYERQELARRGLSTTADVERGSELGRTERLDDSGEGGHAGGI